MFLIHHCLNHHCSLVSELNDISVLDMHKYLQWKEYIKCEGISEIQFVDLVQEQLSSSRVRVIEPERRNKFQSERSKVEMVTKSLTQPR